MADDKLSTPAPKAAVVTTPTKTPAPTEATAPIETPTPHEKAKVPEGTTLHREPNKKGAPYVPKTESPRIPETPTAPVAKKAYVTTVRIKHDGMTYDPGMDFPFAVKDLIESGAIVAK